MVDLDMWHKEYCERRRMTQVVCGRSREGGVRERKTKRDLRMWRRDP